jgi:homopolymeric O-antigen transport system permease protein
MHPTQAAPVVIRPSRGWIGLGAVELWRHRDLAYFLVWRDLKVRYKQTAFGVAWAVLQPVALMLVFSAFLGRIQGIGPAGVPYPLFALSGLVPWTLFSQSLSGASNSLVNSQNLISKVYFPRLLLPLSAVASFIVDFLIASVVLVIAMLFFGRVPPVTYLWVPLLGLYAVIVALAVGLWLAAINVRYRDVKYAIPFLIQVWLFASPVAYSSSLVPAEWRALFSLNPMTGVIEGFRWAALGGPRPDLTIVASAAATLVILVGGLAYFRRVERTFADTI